jgi:phosphopantothenoylcysteine decarboxylase / phosphopantothenate---cysteine ligase
MDFSGKTIALGVTGGIAAYRACDLIRELFRLGAKRVPCLMSDSASAFITPLLLEGLSREPVFHGAMDMDYMESQIIPLHPAPSPSRGKGIPNFVDRRVSENSYLLGTPRHIALAQQADALLIYPATANTIAKLAAGLADDPVSCTAITFSKKPVLIAPAMNTRMWEHPITQANIEKLKTIAGYTFIIPETGDLACGEHGKGHIASQDTTLRALYKVIHPHHNQLQGQKILISAGGTSEAIDPVRILTNKSSGTMGLALADEAFAMGAEVTLVTTKVPSSERAYTTIPVQTAQEMKNALTQEFSQHTALYMAAAVADYRPTESSSQKIKREKQAEITLQLERNDDILSELSAQKQSHQKVFGFAAESEHLLAHAQEKLKRKNLDAIIANDISRSDIGFNVAHNEVIVVLSDGSQFQIERAPKTQIAQELLLKLL